jgi:hypothetical protein
MQFFIKHSRLLIVLLLALTASFSQGADWQLARHDDARNILVYVRDVSDTSYKGFYAVTHVQARLGSVVAVLSDVPAMPEWIARMKSAKLLKRTGDSDVWLHNVYKLPYPFIEREVVLHVSLKQDKNGVVEINTRAEKGLIPANPARVRLVSMSGTWRLTPEANGNVKIEMWGQGNPGGYVPPVLFNYNLPDEPSQTLRQLRKMILRAKYQQKPPGFIREP